MTVDRHPEPTTSVWTPKSSSAPEAENITSLSPRQLGAQPRTPTDDGRSVPRADNEAQPTNEGSSAPKAEDRCATHERRQLGAQPRTWPQRSSALSRGPSHGLCANEGSSVPDRGPDGWAARGSSALSRGLGARIRVQTR
jgi:hypothetical protein